MGKRKNTRSQKFKTADYGVILFCLLGAFFSFWFFWKDLNRVINRNQAPVGTVTFKQRAAQRRLSDRVLWDRLRQESPVYNGDFIRTAGLSDATVTFDTGQKFSLSENSLIQIRVAGDRPVIDLASGDISVENQGQSALVLVSGDKRVELSGTMKARASEDGGFDLEVLEGTAVIRSGEGAIVREAGQAVSVDSRGGIRDSPRVVMLLPKPDEEFADSQETLRVDFSWSPLNFTGPEHTRLEIAADRRFTRLVASLDTEASGAPVELPPGTWWWRAYASASGPEDVAPEKLTILPAAPPVQALVIPAAPIPEVIPEEVPAKPPAVTPTAPVTPPRRKEPEPRREVPEPARPPPPLPAVTERRPENNYVVGPAQIRQSRNLVFRWREAPGANAYIFTLLDASGGKILISGPMAETSYTLDLRGVDRGNFSWQVEAVFQNRGIIERRGTPAENRFTLDIPLPGNPRLRDPGTLYGSEP